MGMFTYFCRFRLLLALLGSCLFTACPGAEKHALILQLRSGTPELEAETSAMTAELEKLLAARDYRVTIAGSAGLIRNSLARLAAGIRPEDELALYVFGYAPVNARRISLSTAEGRMPAAELAELLDGVKGRQTVYLFNSNSAALMGLLARGDRTVAAAQDDPGQLGVPRYPAFYIQALRELGPGAPLGEILKKAGRLTEKFYQENHLALAENSQVYHRGERSSYPFDGSKMLFAAGTGKTPGNAPSDILDILKTQLEQKKNAVKPPTPETLKLLAEAVEKAKDFPDYPAFYLHREASYLLNPDKSAAVTLADTFYISERSGAQMVAPGAVHGLRSARIIYPDGSHCDIAAGSLPTPPPGSILRLERRVSVPRPSHLPEFQAVFQVQSILPVCGFSVSFPKDLKYQFYNLPGTPSRSESDGILTFTGGEPLAAYEQLPHDAFPALIPARLVLTTLPGWEDFMSWVDRMVSRAGELDEDARTLLAGLVKDADGDLDKVKRIYDYLNSVRYVTTPLGAAAFRPQTPGEMIRNGYGDCKDKANALYAMCKELGIAAERVLVNRGGRIDPSFPCWQFNHMIVYLPEHKLWLDATDNLAPFGDLPPGDADSAGILIGQPIRFADIPQAKPTRTRLAINVRADETATVEIEHEGLARYEWQRMLASAETPRQRRYRLESFVNDILPGSELISCDLEPAIRLNIRYGGGMPRLPENLTNPFIPSERKHPIRISDGRRSDFEYRITFENKEFENVQWSRTAPTHAASLAASGNRVDFQFIMEPAPTVGPADYQRVRADLYELYRQINRIKERKRQ